MYDDHPTSIDVVVVVAVNCTRTRPTATPRTADSFPSDAPYAPGAKALETLYAHFKVLLLMVLVLLLPLWRGMQSAV